MRAKVVNPRAHDESVRLHGKGELGGQMEPRFLVSRL